MQPSRPTVERVIGSARLVTIGGLVAAVVGLVVLLVQAMTEVAADPTLSLADGYWIGRLPWTAVGVDLAVGGATIAVLFGSLTAWLARGWIRRVASALVVAVAAFWWLAAMVPPPQGVPCNGCAAPQPDPLTMAYSQPDAAAAFLLLPAAIAAALALRAPRPRGSAVAR